MSLDKIHNSVYTQLCMWNILERKSVQKYLKKTPHQIMERYEAWKRIVEISGPEGLKQYVGFHDEALKGKWAGFRASRLNIKWRVIYLAERDQFEVYVIEITPHKY